LPTITGSNAVDNEKEEEGRKAFLLYFFQKATIKGVL
jgi:hypothetical protein